MFQEEKQIYYATIRDGKWHVKNTAGKEQTFGKVFGMLSSVRVKKQEPKEDQDWSPYEALQIVLEDDTRVLIIKTNIKYNPARSFLLSMPYIDRKKQVTLIAYRNEKNFDAIMIEQDDQRYGSYYTKANPKGKPDWVKTPSGWDSTAETEFFKTKIIEFFRIGPAADGHTGPMPDMPEELWSDDFDKF